MSLPNNQMKIEPAKEQESGSIIKRRIWFHAKLFWSESEAAAAWVWCAEERMSVPKKWALVLSSLALRGYIWKSFAWGSFWVLDPVGSPPHTLGHSPRNLRVAAVPPLLTNLSSRHISQAHTTAVCLSISQFFVKYNAIIWWSEVLR